MAEITAALVKELREKTGAGMMECKKALSETAGDLNGAIDFLRKKGLSVAEKKAGRLASQGLVGVVVEDKKGAIVELNSETDFVARNAEFQSMVTKMLDATLVNNGELEAVKNATSSSLTELIAKIGENMSLRRTASLSVNSGVVVPYMHTAIVPNQGKIGVLVALESNGDTAKLNDLGKKVAMHIAASSPRFLSVDDVDADTLAHEKAIYEEQAKASGKPANIIEKMVEGRIRKFQDEVVLLEQAFIMDPDKKVKSVVADASKELGTNVELTGYVRFALGEGLEKKNEDFAAEVSSCLK